VLFLKDFRARGDKQEAQPKSNVGFKTYYDMRVRLHHSWAWNIHTLHRRWYRSVLRRVPDASLLDLPIFNTGPTDSGLKPGRRWWTFKGEKSIARLRSDGEKCRRSHVVRFYSMLKIPTEYYKDTSKAKFRDISCQMPDSLLGVCCNQRTLMDESGMIKT
jgi:hypothetical protein